MADREELLICFPFLVEFVIFPAVSKFELVLEETVLDRDNGAVVHEKKIMKINRK